MTAMNISIALEGVRASASLARPASTRLQCDRSRPGLHHVLFRARWREDVDTVWRLAAEGGARILRAPGEGQSAPSYYSTLFKDPDDVRLEINYIPGNGLLATDRSR